MSKERKKYQLAKLAIDNCVKDGEEGDYVFVFDKYNFGKQKFEVLSLKKVEEILNSNYEELLRYKELQKKKESLINRISKLRQENQELRNHQSDEEYIRRVCKIIQERIDFVDYNPTSRHVAEHMKRVKEKLQNEDLWRE